MRLHLEFAALRTLGMKGKRITHVFGARFAIQRLRDTRKMQEALAHLIVAQSSSLIELAHTPRAAPYEAIVKQRNVNSVTQPVHVRCIPSEVAQGDTNLLPSSQVLARGAHSWHLAHINHGSEVGTPEAVVVDTQRLR